MSEILKVENLNVSFKTSDGLPKNDGYRISLHNDTVILTHLSGIYYFHSATQKFEVYQELVVLQ